MKCYFPRWERDFPDDPEVLAALKCPCGCSLLRESPSGSESSSRWAKRESKIVLDNRKRPAKVVFWVYDKCSDCGTTYSSISPEILLQLPRRARSALPFSPLQIMKGSSVVFGYGIEKDADFDLVQYENSSAVVCKCREGMEEMFEEHRNDYNDHIRSWREFKGDYATKFPEFPEFPNWFGRSQIPDARTMTEHYKQNFYTVGSAGTTESRNMYRTRQMQSVEVEDESVSTDHTHDAAKNCCKVKGQPDITKVWNCVSAKIIAACSLYVKSTSKTELIHAIEELLHRQKFRPNRNFTDTWPSDRFMWESLWPFCEGRLDIFHWMKRILDTLHHQHADFHVAQMALRNCIFYDNADDVRLVEEDLRAGLLGTRGKFEDGDPEFDQCLQELKSTGAFHRLYSKFFETQTYNSNTVNGNVKGRSEAQLDKYDPKKGVVDWTEMLQLMEMCCCI